MRFVQTVRHCRRYPTMFFHITRQKYAAVLLIIFYHPHTDIVKPGTHKIFVPVFLCDKVTNYYSYMRA